MGGVGDPVLRGRGIEQGRGSMQLTGEEACWLMLGRESKIASSLEEQQWSFSEGSSKRAAFRSRERGDHNHKDPGKDWGRGGDRPGLPPELY